MTKTVLFIANVDEPRINGLTEYLPEYGWSTKWFTLSTEPDFMYDVGHNQLDVLRRKLRPLARLGYRVFREFAHYPRYSASVNFTYWLKDVSVIVASGPPFDSFLIASHLSRKHHIPWIGDYRDLWTQNHNYVYTPVRRAIERRLERQTVRTASGLTTVSPEWVMRLGSISSNTRWFIPNGFHPNDYRERILAKRDFGKFRITYAGRIYSKQRPRELLSMLPERVEVHYYGPTPEKLNGQCEDANVFIHDSLPHDNLMQVLRSSDLLWLMNFPKENGWMSLKLYAYLAARRPIIITDSGPNDCKRRLLEETKAGTACVDRVNVRQALLESYNDWAKWGMLHYYGVHSMVTLHTQKQSARQMSKVLDRVSE